MSYYDIEDATKNLESNKPVSGSFPEKPENYVSLFSLLKTGYIPKEDTSKMFAMPSDSSKGYLYFDKDNVRELDPDEKEDFENYVALRRSEKAKKLVLKPKPEVIKDQKKQKSNKPGYPDFKSMQGRKIVCFDTETTGVSKDDEILQLSAWELCEDKMSEVYQGYFKPLRHSSWKEAENVNKISPEMVKNSPFIVEKISELKRIFEAADYVVGYNVAFDVGMLKNNTGIEIPENKLADPILYFRDKEKDMSHKLIDAVRFYCPEKLAEFEGNAHDAGADTKAALDVLVAQAKREDINLFAEQSEKDRNEMDK